MSERLVLSNRTGYTCSYARLQVLFHEAIKIVEEMGYPLEKLNRTCEINTRYTSRWGSCYPDSKKGNRIEVSTELLKSDEKNIMTTLIHEVLHSTVGCHNHGDLWKSRADAINRKYGYNIKCRTAETDKISEEDIIKHNKYVFRCKRCGKLISKNRECPFVKSYSNYIHTDCNGKWERIK